MKKIFLGLFLLASLTAKSATLLEECDRWVGYNFEFSHFDDTTSYTSCTMSAQQWIHCKHWWDNPHVTEPGESWWEFNCHYLTKDSVSKEENVKIYTDEFNNNIYPNTSNKEILYDHDRTMTEDVELYKDYICYEGSSHHFSKYRNTPSENLTYTIDTSDISEETFNNAFEKSEEE